MSVLHGVSLELTAGEFVLLLGPNGAGKTTLLRTIAGFLPIQSGTVEFDGRSVVGSKPERLAKAGLRLVLEGHRIFPELSVEDNLRLGQLALGGGGSVQARLEEVKQMFPFLAEKYAQPANDLSGGQQQLLALAQAFIGNPRVMMCDEPSLGVAQGLHLAIFGFLRGLADKGATVLVVEQLPQQALAFANRVIVLRQGVVAAEGPPEEFAADDYLQKLFLEG